MSGEIISHDQKFLHLTIPTVKLERLCTGMLWTEGPVYFPLGDYLLWSDIPNNRIMQWMDGVGSRIYREDSNNSNGNTRDHQGRLITCEHRSRRVTRTEHDGSITVLADSYDGKRLNSPNDVVMKSDGTIWFTDPPYGILSDFEGKKSPQEQKACNVFRLDLESGSLDVVIDDFDKPNGLAFSPDESVLYVSDTGISHTENGPRHIRALDVADGKTLSNSRVFAEIENGAPDGFRLDVEGNIWTSTGGGVQCFSPEGKLLGEIVIDEMVANVTFGGPKNNRLFITATTSLYSIFLGTNGLV
ncbi:MAG: SMP-30/gluconolactonase/LRE family protein [Rhizobiaceae bacterium]|nr:SMP-30/gluconolactonase/LRE family protein [Rhizobiaceae bacterium]